MVARSGHRPGAVRGKADAGETERILAAAESVFAEHGFPETRMQDIAAEARVSLRSVYAASNSKANLFRRLQTWRAGDLLKQIETALSDEDEDACLALMKVISVVAIYLMAHPDFLRIQLSEGGTWALDEPDRDLLVDERHASDRLLERLFRRGIRTGVFHREEPRMMLASLRAQEQVQLAAWLARRGRASKKGTIEAIQRQARRLFCR